MRRTAYLGLYLALALVCSYIESLIPISFGIPGIKLGLANVVVILVLYDLGAAWAAAVSVLRILLAGFMFGNMFSIIYSLSGGLLSLGCMLLLKKTGKFKIISVSAAGGVTHNLGQIIAAALVVENINLFYYYPVLLTAGVITGVLIGTAAQEIVLRLPHDQNR
ncbi:MAG: Gx transporter family protein [Eubacterium sp.]|nr:Gx transporter family protein [Eubacterium sp.]MCI8918866.1 Gx transporter family protein [Eubacterium sp.]